MLDNLHYCLINIYTRNQQSAACKRILPLFKSLWPAPVPASAQDRKPLQAEPAVISPESDRVLEKALEAMQAEPKDTKETILKAPSHRYS